MTELLNAEDIKQAIGAFAGEQRAPLLIPFPPHPFPLIHHLRPGTRSVLPTFLLPTHPAGCWRGPGRGGHQPFRELRGGGLPQTQKLEGSEGWLR